MSRIEKGQDSKEGMQQLKGEVIKEIRSQNRGRPWITCSLLFLVIIFGLLSAGAWAVAATGLVNVPGFTSWAYHPPVPERTVLPGVPMERVVDERVKSLIAQRLQDGQGKLSQTAISLEISEQSLTASLRSALGKQMDDTLDSATAQVRIDPDTGFTFFVLFKNSPRASALQFSVYASAHDGTVELKPERFIVGSLPIPNALTAFFLQPFIQSKLNDFNALLGSYVQMKSIDYQAGVVIINGDLAVQIKEGQP
ncbi:hypothetical protein HZA85_02695 [Candidatus Uhrbacteria bacterium]|nr:hypothetical protein [Candidatus Uhrbacteria bacterium]